MVTLVQKKLFSGDKVKEFKAALFAFVALFILILLVLATSFLFRGESFQKACEEVQENNSKLVTYLSEAEERAIDRIHLEVSEGKIPPNNKTEIEASFGPVIRTFKPVNC